MNRCFYKDAGAVFLLFFSILFSQISFGQLATFSLHVTSVNETCTANGSLTFTTSGTAPGAIVLFRIYKLPDTINPITITNNNTFGGLTSGNYRIEAIQSLGNLSNTQTQNINIANLISPLAFHIFSTPVQCGATGSITVNVNNGNPVSYELISGPILATPQSSNVFTGLVPGHYDIRVKDDCGEGLVQTFLVSEVPLPSFLGVQVSTVPSCIMTDCNTLPYNFDVYSTVPYLIPYPLQIELTVFPPGGGPTFVLNQTLVSGSPSLQDFTMNTPQYHAPYQVIIKITDPCGNVMSVPFTIGKPPEMSLGIQPSNSCVKQLHASGCGLMKPYMVSFLTAPPGFVPSNFNPNNLGPFNTVTYSSTATHELPDGFYDLQLTDACGTVVHDTITVKKSETDIISAGVFDPCELKYGIQIPFEGVPIVTVTLVAAPVGFGYVLPHDFTSSIVDNIFTVSSTVPGIYTFTGTNICGEQYIVTTKLLPPDFNLEYLVTPDTGGCMNPNGEIKFNNGGNPALSTVIITQAPSAFNHILPYDASAFIGDPTLHHFHIDHLPAGDYTFIVSDVCGHVYTTLTLNVPSSLGPPEVIVLKGCETGFGSLRIKSETPFDQVVITSAPSNYSHVLPYDVSFNLYGGTFYMNSFPEGAYVFHTRDLCGIEHDVAVEILGTHILQNDVTIFGNCNSFDLALNHYQEQPYLQMFWLQKWNAVLNQWGNPFTGSLYTSGTVPNDTNSYLVYNYATNFNIAALGTFRVLKQTLIFSNGNADYFSCYDVIKEFEFTGQLKINSATSIACSNGGNGIYIEAEGIAPFIYRITTKNGQPFFVDNGNVNIFSGLSPAIYNFQVQDVCGNIVNRLLDTSTLTEPTVAAYNLCDGQNAQLSVPAISFLSYQWWEGNNPNTILSVTNTLNFTPFSNSTTPGVYHVRIYSTSNLSCIDATISYTVPTTPMPNAGLDGVRTLCGNSNSVDLFSILGPPFDGNGLWEETTSTGMLTGSNWFPSALPYGTYSFKYTVTNPCGNTDEALVTILFKPIPEEPIISTGPIFCEGSAIQLNVNSIPNASYHWTGPNGFLSDEQNPIIANSSPASSGIYTVIATINGCDSSNSIALTLQSIPDFIIVPSCINNVYTISVVPEQNTFAIENAVYAWTGPNNFTSTESVIQPTNSALGLYEVNVTTPGGCRESHTINVTSVTCAIPNAITPNNDGNNDFFDLTGFNVDRIEIYSRWGRLVYNRNGYIKEWHGQNMKGQELPDSTYYYILYFKSGQQKQGWVYKTAWH